VPPQPLESVKCRLRVLHHPGGETSLRHREPVAGFIRILRRDFLQDFLRLSGATALQQRAGEIKLRLRLRDRDGTQQILT
jgi:hypothetical protein